MGLTEFDFPHGSKPNVHDVHSDTSEAVPFQIEYTKNSQGAEAREGMTTIMTTIKVRTTHFSTKPSAGLEAALFVFQASSKEVKKFLSDDASYALRAA